MRTTTSRAWAVVAFVGCVLAAPGCGGSGSAGRPFDTTHAREVHRGEGDRASIRATFGEPYATTALSGNPQGCVERWQYSYATAHTGSPTHVQVLIVDFDAAGAVCDAAYQEMDQ